MNKQQEESIAAHHKERRKARRRWIENQRNGIWQPACDKPDFRTDAEMEADFLKNGFQ